MPIELDAAAADGEVPTTSTEGDAPPPEGTAAASGSAGDQASGTPPPAIPAGDKPGTPAEPAKPGDKPAGDKPEDGRVVELSRGKRAAETERDGLKGKLAEAEGKLTEYQPVIDLVGLATTDPVEFISQMAVATGLTPERVQETLAARGTAALSVEERLAALQRRIDEREERDRQAADEAKKRADDAAHADNRTKNVAGTGTFLKEHAKDFPLCDADGAEAAEAVYELVEQRWMQLPAAERPREKAGLAALYREAAVNVEQVLKAETERRAPRLGYQRASQGAAGSAPAPQSTGGLSNELMGASPPPDQIRDDDEIRESWLRELGQ